MLHHVGSCWIIPITCGGAPHGCEVSIAAGAKPWGWRAPDRTQDGGPAMFEAFKDTPVTSCPKILMILLFDVTI